MIINHQDLLDKYVNSELCVITDYNAVEMRKQLLAQVTDYVARYNTYNREILTVPQDLIDICVN